ncbi:hypothetical protein [Collimonas fungivorans]|nr:hypothetical protein [Collimonas fungivorans]
MFINQEANQEANQETNQETNQEAARGLAELASRLPASNKAAGYIYFPLD